jgi:hypothetical protein
MRSSSDQRVHPARRRCCVSIRIEQRSVQQLVEGDEELGVARRVGHAQADAARQVVPEAPVLPPLTIRPIVRVDLGLRGRAAPSFRGEWFQYLKNRE